MRPRTIWLLAIGAAASLLLALFLMLQGDPDGPEASVQADVFSKSALGHSGLARLLERSGRHVVVDRSPFDVWPDADSVTVAAEPNTVREASARMWLERLLSSRERVLLVLPKRYGTGDRDGWITSAGDVPLEEAQAMFDATHARGSVVRESGPMESLEFPGTPVRRLALSDVQLVRSDDLIPVVGSADGMLVGRLRHDRTGPEATSDADVIVLADPDVIANHGLLRAEHADLALDVIDLFADAGDTVVFDETLHGFQRQPTLWRALTSFPLSLPLSAAVLATLVAVWSGVVRFGAPAPPPARFGSGRRVLLENTSELLVNAGHVAYLVERQLAHAVTAVARAYHVHADADLEQRLDAATRASEARGARDRPRQLRDRLLEITNGPRARREQARPLLRLADRVHIWKEEVLHGPGTDRRDR